MTEVTNFVIPKRPEDTAAMWKENGRGLLNKKDGFWLEYRDVTIGPFPNKSEASWYDGQVQDICLEVKDKKLFAGRVVNDGDDLIGPSWYVERWEQFDGPFLSAEEAIRYRQQLYDTYNTYPDDYVGITFQRGKNKFWVDRGHKDDGPFYTMDEAKAYRAQLMNDIKKNKEKVIGN